MGTTTRDEPTVGGLVKTAAELYALLVEARELLAADPRASELAARIDVVLDRAAGRK